MTGCGCVGDTARVASSDCCEDVPCSSGNLLEVGLVVEDNSGGKPRSLVAAMDLIPSLGNSSVTLPNMLRKSSLSRHSTEGSVRTDAKLKYNSSAFDDAVFVGSRLNLVIPNEERSSEGSRNIDIVYHEGDPQKERYV